MRGRIEREAKLDLEGLREDLREHLLHRIARGDVLAAALLAATEIGRRGGWKRLAIDRIGVESSTVRGRVGRVGDGSFGDLPIARPPPI